MTDINEKQWREYQIEVLTISLKYHVQMCREIVGLIKGVKEAK